MSAEIESRIKEAEIYHSMGLYSESVSVYEQILSDGGDLELVSIEDKTVRLKLKGACHGCPHAMMTIKQGIEQALREAVDPGITVEAAG